MPRSWCYSYFYLFYLCLVKQIDLLGITLDELALLIALLDERDGGERFLPLAYPVANFQPLSKCSTKHIWVVTFGFFLAVAFLDLRLNVFVRLLGPLICGLGSIAVNDFTYGFHIVMCLNMRRTSAHESVLIIFICFIHRVFGLEDASMDGEGGGEWFDVGVMATLVPCR